MTSYLEEELGRLQQEIYKINLKKGWFDVPRTPGEDIALIHSEVSEILEEVRNGRWSTDFEDVTQKPIGVGPECADVLIRLLDFCTRYQVNIGKEVYTKLEYNRSRENRHGGKAL